MGAFRVNLPSINIQTELPPRVCLEVRIKRIEGLDLYFWYPKILFRFFAKRGMGFRFLCPSSPANVTPVVLAIAQIIVPADVNGAILTQLAQERTFHFLFCQCFTLWQRLHLFLNVWAFPVLD